MSLHVPGHSGPTANPLEVLNAHLDNLVKVMTSQSMQTHQIAETLAQMAGPPQIEMAHVPAITPTESGAWAVFCLGCTAAVLPDGEFIYPCQLAPEDPSHPWPPQLLMTVPESPEGHTTAPS